MTSPGAFPFGHLASGTQAPPFPTMPMPNSAATQPFAPTQPLLHAVRSAAHVPAGSMAHMSWSMTNVLAYTTGHPNRPIMVAFPSFDFPVADRTPAAAVDGQQSAPVFHLPVQLRAISQPLPLPPPAQHQFTPLPGSCGVACNAAGSLIAAADLANRILLWKNLGVVNQWSSPECFQLDSHIVFLSWIQRSSQHVDPREDPAITSFPAQSPSPDLLVAVTRNGHMHLWYPSLMRFRHLTIHLPASEPFQLESIAVSTTTAGPLVVVAGMNPTNPTADSWLVDFSSASELSVTPIPGPTLHVTLPDASLDGLLDPSGAPGSGATGGSTLLATPANVAAVGTSQGTWVGILHPALGGMAMYLLTFGDVVLPSGSGMWNKILDVPIDVPETVRLSPQSMQSALVLYHTSPKDRRVSLVRFGGLGGVGAHEPPLWSGWLSTDKFARMFARFASQDLPSLDCLPTDPMRAITDVCLSPNGQFFASLSITPHSPLPHLTLVPIHHDDCPRPRQTPLPDSIPSSTLVAHYAHLCSLAILGGPAVRDVGDIILHATMHLQREPNRSHRRRHRGPTLGTLEAITSALFTSLNRWLKRVESSEYALRTRVWQRPHSLMESPLLARIFHVHLRFARAWNLAPAFTATMAALQTAMTAMTVKLLADEMSAAAKQAAAVAATNVKAKGEVPPPAGPVLPAELVMPSLASVMWVQDWVARGLRQLLFTLAPLSSTTSAADADDSMAGLSKGLISPAAILLHPGFGSAVLLIFDLVDLLYTMVRSSSAMDATVCDQVRVLLNRSKVQHNKVQSLLQQISQVVGGATAKAGVVNSPDSSASNKNKKTDSGLGLDDEQALLCGTRIPFAIARQVAPVVDRGVKESVVQQVHLGVNEGVWVDVDLIVGEDDKRSWAVSGAVLDVLGQVYGMRVPRQQTLGVPGAAQSGLGLSSMGMGSATGMAAAADPGKIMKELFAEARRGIDVVRKVELARADQLMQCTSCYHFTMAAQHPISPAEPSAFSSQEPPPHVWAPWCNNYAYSCICGGRWWHLGMLEEETKQYLQFPHQQQQQTSHYR